jgi:hypothetical protein
MSGETTIAKEMIAGAMAQAEQDPGMSEDSMAHAILSAILTTLCASRSRRDIDNYIEFELDNQDDSDTVITRGC